MVCLSGMTMASPDWRSEDSAVPDHSPDDSRDVRIRELEDAIADIAHQAQAAKMALCENELQIRLENILRRAEAAQRLCRIGKH